MSIFLVASNLRALQISTLIYQDLRSKALCHNDTDKKPRKHQVRVTLFSVFIDQTGRLINGLRCL
jgi:hypothetical protein